MRRRALLSAAPAALVASALPAPPPADLRSGTIDAGDHLVTASLPIGTYAGSGPETRLICAPGVDSLFSGTGALLLRKMTDRPQISAPPVKAKLTTVPTAAEPKKEAAPEKAATPRKTPATTRAKKTAGRRAGATELRSTN